MNKKYEFVFIINDSVIQTVEVISKNIRSARFKAYKKAVEEENVDKIDARKQYKKLIPCIKNRL